MRVSMTIAGAVLALASSAMVPGCGPDVPEIDKSARYTPESLAEELAFRFRTLKPEARKLTRGAGGTAGAAKRAAGLERARQAEKKGGEADVPKKRAGAPTLDEVMADIDSKVDKVQGTPRPEVCRKMSEALAKDASLSADDKKLLAGRLEEMGAQ